MKSRNCFLLTENGVCIDEAANTEFRVSYSQRYLVLGLVGLVGLSLWLVSGIALNKYCCEYGTLKLNVCH